MVHSYLTHLHVAFACYMAHSSVIRPFKLGRTEEEEFEVDHTQNLLLGRFMLHLQDHVLELPWLFYLIPLHRLDSWILRVCACVCVCVYVCV